MTAEEFQARFAEVLASGETIYVPSRDEAEYIGENATPDDTDEYAAYVEDMTGVAPARGKAIQSESQGMIVMQEYLWRQWCNR